MRAQLDYCINFVEMKEKRQEAVPILFHLPSCSRVDELEIFPEIQESKLRPEDTIYQKFHTNHRARI